jgi:hypothetical protein
VETRRGPWSTAGSNRKKVTARRTKPNLIKLASAALYANVLSLQTYSNVVFRYFTLMSLTIVRISLTVASANGPVTS